MLLCKASLCRARAFQLGLVLSSLVVRLVFGFFGWVAFVTPFNRTDVCETAVGRAARITLVSSADRLALKLLGPILGHAAGLGPVCLLEGIIFRALLFPC